LTAGSSTCNCFTRGYTDTIPVPTNPNAVISCPYQCIDAILKYTNLYMVNVNGPGDDLSQKCSASLDTLGTVEYGNKNDYVPTDSDTDALDIVPVDDPRVIQASSALAQYINSNRASDCPTKTAVADDATKTIVYAKRGMGDGGRGQYRLEVLFGNEVVFARIAHLTKDDQLVDPSNKQDDPNNYDGRYAVVTVTPDPCGDAVADQLAVSATGVTAINKQGLPWKAMLKGEFEGRTVGSFGTGLKHLPEEVRKQYIVSLDTAGFVPPVAYDARDVLANQPSCTAFSVADQGACGSCYAFSSATSYSARLCRFNPGSIGNVFVSPQEMMDCANGCDGGNPITVFTNLFETPVVENWCDPYQQKKGTCGSSCGKSNSYSAQAGTVKVVGSDGAAGVLQMQMELLRGGPGVVMFDIYDDFQAYSSGVYIKSSAAKQIGGHAVTLIGFGVDGGVPYWLIQNSWGPNWGLNGFAKIRRGTNECNLETYGLNVVKPLAPAVCAASNCQNGASTLRDCSCRCSGGWTGPQCSTCALSCENGGTLDSACSQCACPPGYFGTRCEGFITVSPVATLINDKKVLTITFSFGGTAVAPTQQSFVGIYKLTETNTVNTVTSVYLCGTKYNSALNGGLCPSSGTVTLSPPTVAGTYKIALAPYLPTNEFGQSGYSTLLSASSVIGQYTLFPFGTASTLIQAALTSNSPASLFAAQQATAAAAAAANQAAMTARLALATPIINSLNQQLPPSVSVTGIDPVTPIMWASGPPSQVCYYIPTSNNVNPKALALYVGDGSSGSYYPTGLSGAGPSTPLAADYQGCVSVNVAAGIPSGPYTIQLVDLSKAPVQTPIAGVSFTVAQASVGFSSYSTSASLTLTVTWSVDANVATPSDTVKIYNTAGTIVYWFFTSSGGSTLGKAAVPSGSLSFSIVKQNAVPGGYTPKLFPGGGAVVAAIGTNWINWASIGW